MKIRVHIWTTQTKIKKKNLRELLWKWVKLTSKIQHANRLAQTHHAVIVYISPKDHKINKAVATTRNAYN